MSAFAFTAGWSIRRISRASSWTLPAIAFSNGSSSIASSSPGRLGVLGEGPDVVRDELEDLLGAEHLEVAVVLPCDEQHVPAAEVRLLVDEGAAAVEREAPNGRREVDKAERDADRGADREVELLARLLDRAPRVVVQLERVLGDVVGVEADLLRLAHARDDADARPVPRGADQPELSDDPTVRPPGRCAPPARVPGGRPSAPAEQLDLEAAAVAAVDADEVLERRPVVDVGHAGEHEHGAPSGMPRCCAISLLAARDSIARVPRWSLKPSSRSYVSKSERCVMSSSRILAQSA